MDTERRAFLAFLSAALATRSIPANAQQATQIRTVAVLMGLANDQETQARAKVIEQGLAKKGWVVGQNLRIEYRFAAGDVERMLILSKELVALRPDVIIGHSTPVVVALHEVTQTIPIVFVVVSDPVGSGFVASIARPSGNITGFSVMQQTITGKYLSILRELRSQLTRGRPSDRMNFRGCFTTYLATLVLTLPQERLLGLARERKWTERVLAHLESAQKKEIDPWCSDASRCSSG